MNILDLVRDNIKALKPYSSARDEYKGTAEVYLDANENPFDHQFSRYPDPRQLQLKKKIASWRNVAIESIFLGNGSDEVIDLLIRIFCRPGIDNIISLDPSYGMYEVSANINNVILKKVALREDFTLDLKSIQATVDGNTKIIFLCSPNNPSANELDYDQLKTFIKKTNSIVVIDEAYIDFAEQASMIHSLAELPNLVVMQTLSKAMGSAALRVGMAFASPLIISLLNKVKPPYNISSPSQIEALKIFDNLDELNAEVKLIKRERSRLMLELTRYKQITKIFPSAANFILIKVDDAKKLYDYLSQQGIIVRNRHGQLHCDQCIRITIGTPDENQLLIYKLDEYYNAEVIVSR